MFSSGSKNQTKPGNRHTFAEQLDRDLVLASLSAEKATARTGDNKWSIALKQARLCASILSKCLSMARTQIDLTTIMIQKDMKRLDSSFLLPVTARECSQQLRQVQREIRQLAKRSFIQRSHECEEQIKGLEKSWNPQDQAKKKILKCLKRAESVRQLFTKFSGLRNVDCIRQDLTSLEEVPIQEGVDPKTCTEWKTIDVPEEMLDLLLIRNQNHFARAQGSPFTIPPFLSID